MNEPMWSVTIIEEEEAIFFSSLENHVSLQTFNPTNKFQSLLFRVSGGYDAPKKLPYLAVVKIPVLCTCYTYPNTGFLSVL